MPPNVERLEVKDIDLIKSYNIKSNRKIIKLCSQLPSWQPDNQMEDPILLVSHSETLHNLFKDSRTDGG